MDSENKIDLSGVPTCVLVDELSKREGVKTIINEPANFEDVSIEVPSPSVVLVVID